jgi:hypothetical protein
MKARLITTSIFILSFFTQSVSAQVNIQNPDFENSTDWSFYNTGLYWTGQYSTGWASHGLRSYEIHIPLSATCDNYPGENTYGEVFQNVDLTSVNGIIYDLRTFGSWDIPVLGPDYYHSVEVWIDGTKVYTHEREKGEFDNQVISITGLSGIHRLAFRMQGHASFCSSANRGLNIDNIRFINSFKYYLPLIFK